jgi:glutathione peroxidase
MIILDRTRSTQTGGGKGAARKPNLSRYFPAARSAFGRGGSPSVYRKLMGWDSVQAPWHGAAFLLDAGRVHMASSVSGGFGAMDGREGAIYAFSAPMLAGQPVSLEAYSGQVLLIVNTASKCGFTPQYAGLQEVYRAYKDRGFAVLGFPCNQFGRQEPGSAEEIGAFCEQKYGVTFPMFARIEVNGANAHPLYRFLKRSKPGLFGFLGSDRIRWNFTKFLVDRRGNVVARFGSSTAPTSLKGEIERLLAE